MWQNPSENDKTALHAAVEMAHKKCATMLVEVGPKQFEGTPQRAATHYKHRVTRMMT